MTDRLWVLSASDPEMAAIKRLLDECGEAYAYAMVGGRRVHAGNAYRAELPPEAPVAAAYYVVECGLAMDYAPGECAACGEERPVLRWHGAALCAACGEGGADGNSPDGWLATCAILGGAPVTIIDHHRPGDPGYGRPPAEFLAASSIGQVVAVLARLDRLPGLESAYGPTDGPGGKPGEYTRYAVGMAEPWAVVMPTTEDGMDSVWLVPDDLVLTAAADHCLRAAYRGECPGVDPDDLMDWRVASRAEYQGRDASEIEADIERARKALNRAPCVAMGVMVADMRCRDTLGLLRQYGAPVRTGPSGWEWESGAWVLPHVVPELPEAAMRDDVPYVAGPLNTPDGRCKIVCSGPPPVIEAFLAGEGPAADLIDMYGDPARGFAGGYINISWTKEDEHD